jgi:endonuclease YncB( thermonuclease family)
MGQCLSILVDVLQAASQEQQQQPQQESQPQGTPDSASSPDAAASYSALPANAEKQEVRNVYDGDTLTLKDGRRVRLLGVDTPEVKEQQPFAQEAKAYTKNLCNDHVWISLEPNAADQQDHYGRLLAHVWVSTSHNNKYLCVNEGLVANGFASAYTPNATQAKLHNWDKLLQLQSQARQQKRGMWSSFQDVTVYKTANGAAFHKRDCKHLAKIKNVHEIQQSRAMEIGLHACRTCMG